MRAYLRNSKLAEARVNLGSIARGAEASFERETISDAILKPGAVATVTRRFCPSAKHPVPAEVPKGKKWMGRPGDWNDEAWKCLTFQLSDPHYFQYHYESSGSDSNATFVARAVGDLDGDGKLVKFVLRGKVMADGRAKRGELAEEP